MSKLQQWNQCDNILEQVDEGDWYSVEEVDEYITKFEEALGKVIQLRKRFDFMRNPHKSALWPSLDHALRDLCKIVEDK